MKKKKVIKRKVVQKPKKVKRSNKKLTSQARNSLPSKAFVFPGKRAYPIHDISHARNALARVSGLGTSAEKAAVRRAVYRKYPNLKS